MSPTRPFCRQLAALGCLCPRQWSLEPRLEAWSPGPRVLTWGPLWTSKDRIPTIHGRQGKGLPPSITILTWGAPLPTL